jgi:hypothetical protein
LTRHFSDLCVRVFGLKGAADTHYGGLVRITGDNAWMGAERDDTFRQGAINNVKTNLTGLDRAASTVSSGLRGLTGVFGIAGLATLAAGCKPKAAPAPEGEGQSAADEMLYRVKSRGRSGWVMCGEDGELSDSARLHLDVLNVPSGLL